MKDLGKSLIILGLALTAAGVVISVTPRFFRLGHLPGDIYIKKGSFTFSFPLTTCLLLSAAISLLLWLVRR